MTSAVSSSAYLSLIAGSQMPNWLASAQSAIQASAHSAGILGALSGQNDVTSIANDFASIATNNVSSASSFYAQIAAQNAQIKQQKQLQDALTALNDQQAMVQPGTNLDPFIYLPDGTSIDTTNNIMTMPDGSQYDTVSGAKYTDPASIVQMANGSYLNTSTNILTMTDGTQIDTVTGLIVATSA